MPSAPVKVRPRKGDSWGRPCSWTRGGGLVVKVDRRGFGGWETVDCDGSCCGVGVVRAVRRDWTGSMRVVRGDHVDDGDRRSN